MYFRISQFLSHSYTCIVFTHHKVTRNTSQNDHLIKKVWWKVGCKVFCCMFFRSGQLILKLIKKIVLIQSRNRMHTDQSILSVIEQPNKCTI